MVQELSSQPSFFGSLGKGIGRGLAREVPRIAERQRLSKGLQELGNQKGLSPYQQFAGLAGVAHEYPQIVQSGGDLLRQQSIMDAYRRGRGNRDIDQNQPQMPQNNLNQVQFGQQQGQPKRQQNEQQVIPQNFENREQEAQANPPAAAEHPLNEKYLTKDPWNQQKQEQAINEAFDRGLATNFDQANEYANKQREFYENAPDTYKKQLNERKAIDQEVDDKYQKQLETRLQKQGNETFGDIPGDLQLNIKKQARNAVATGKMTPDQAAEYYSKKSLDLAKDRNRVLQIANRDILDRVNPYKKDENLKNLMHVGKSFKEMGSSEYLYNLLRSDKIDDTGRQQGMGLSPGGAAVIAYERSPDVKDLEKKTKIFSLRKYDNTRDFADKLLKVMSPEDSFLAIARNMKQQDMNFDEYAFFDYLRENRDRFASNERLDDEVSNGVSDFFPNWRDIGLFPAFTKAVTND